MTDLFFSQIDDVIERSVEEQEPFEQMEVVNEELGGDVIITFGDTYRVLDKGLVFIEGTYCVCNEETGELEPDFSLTLIYEDIADEKFDLNNYLYFEQDDPVVTIHNFLRAREGRKQSEKENVYFGSPYADARCV